jgi:hypothetical protein
MAVAFRASMAFFGAASAGAAHACDGGKGGLAEDLRDVAGRDVADVAERR